MNGKLADAVREISQKLKSKNENGNEIAIITHLDADGVTAGGILGIALNRLGGRYSISAMPSMNYSLIEKMKADSRDFYVLTDLGGGWSSSLKVALGDKWVMIDHHQVTNEETLTDDTDQILNPWKFGIDGGTHISAGGLTYMVANALNSKNRDLSALAVVSAVADRQDVGEKKSLIGLNAEILKTAQSLGLVTVDLDMLLTGGETSPLHEALAYTSTIFVEGLSWSPQACYSLFTAAGVMLKDNSGRWRVLSEFSDEEKSKVVEEIIKFTVASKNRNPGLTLDELIGYVYTITAEDKSSQLRDAREFSAILNACGRLGRPGVGIALCMGDRSASLNAGAQLLQSYRSILGTYISRILSEKWRMDDDGKTLFINGEGLVDENMVGALASLLSHSTLIKGRLIFARTLTRADTYKFSSRKSLNCDSVANLGVILRNCSEAFRGNGGGHSAAAGCSIPKFALDEFIVSVKAALNETNERNDSSPS